MDSRAEAPRLPLLCSSSPRSDGRGGRESFDCPSPGADKPQDACARTRVRRRRSRAYPPLADSVLSFCRARLRDTFARYRVRVCRVSKNVRPPRGHGRRSARVDRNRTFPYGIRIRQIRRYDFITTRPRVRIVRARSRLGWAPRRRTRVVCGSSPRKAFRPITVDERKHDS